MQQIPEMDHVLELSVEELRAFQEADPTLTAVRGATSRSEKDDLTGIYFKKDGLLYHRRNPAGRAGKYSTVEQLVLPKKCHKTALNLAHNVPKAGHLGKQKTADSILQRFYWPGVHRDVTSYCKGCAECQKLSRGKACRVPLVPLPVISEPFERIAPYGHSGATTQEQSEQLAWSTEGVCSSLPGRMRLAEHPIECGSAKPIRLAPYRIPHAYRKAVQQEIKEMLEGGIIEPSSSEWCSPMVIVKKKDKSLRICVDYRRLNSVSQVDAYPMPRIDDTLDQLGNAKFISTMDLTRGYWQVPVEQKAHHKMAFSTPFGLYQFKMMPFGLQGAPATADGPRDPGNEWFR